MLNRTAAAALAIVVLLAGGIGCSSTLNPQMVADVEYGEFAQIMHDSMQTDAAADKAEEVFKAAETAAIQMKNSWLAHESYLDSVELTSNAFCRAFIAYAKASTKALSAARAAAAVNESYLVSGRMVSRAAQTYSLYDKAFRPDGPYLASFADELYREAYLEAAEALLATFETFVAVGTN
jgi:hypothetical protein